MRSQDRDLLVEAPLAVYAEGYEAELCRLGYHSRQVCRHLTLLWELSGWMQHRGLVVELLCSERLDKFFAERRRQGCVWLVTTRCAAALVAWLAEAGVSPLSAPLSAGSIDELVVDYREHLVRQRGLAAGTVKGYERVARLFSSAGAADAAALGALTAGDVNRFVADFCAQPVGVSPRELVVADLRSFLRFLYLRGVTRCPAGAERPELLRQTLLAGAPQMAPAAGTPGTNCDAPGIPCRQTRATARVSRHSSCRAGHLGAKGFAASSADLSRNGSIYDVLCIMMLDRSLTEGA